MDAAAASPVPSARVVPTAPADAVSVLSLAAAAPGTRGTLRLGRVAPRHGMRLAQLGLRSGAEVTVLSRTAGGGRLVGIGTARIGLDRETSRRLELHTTGPLA